ncbi:cell division protein FtsQ/DivIB [Pseudarthrobacter sp. N5]|uniref:cell division protein FtsQ/DivIB n=1 Tax=Pseudarthrobacter sp. N5 TaxID=3418416 RepID=UPI003CFB67A9
MASTRKPTYKSRGRLADRDQAASRDQTASQDLPGSGKQAASQTATRRRSQGQDTISASKSAGYAADGRPAGPVAGISSNNVLSFPEPKGRRLKRNILIAACVVTAVVAGLLAAAVYSPVLALRTVTVTGTKLLSAEQIQTALEPLRGKPLPQVSDEDVSRLLEPLVQIKSVTTQSRPPSALVVQVQERVPVALVKQGEQYLLVDVDGVQLGTTADPASVSLPLIDGGAGAIGKGLFQATAAVLGALPAEVLAKLSNASAQSVDAVELKLVDGQIIVWGNSGERELKSKVLTALLKVPADARNPVRVYDVSVPRHPVTR